MEVVIIWLPVNRRASATPFSAILSDSVPPLVKTISLARQFNKPEILFLSFSPGLGSISVGIFFIVSIGIFDSSIRFNSI